MFQDMANPKEMVDARLLELGLSKTDFAKRLGYTTYQGYHDLFGPNPRTKLTEKKLEQIAEALEWPRNHFRNPTETLKREDYIKREFQKFLASDVGREADPETIKVLESMRWTGDILPTAKLYIAFVMAMEERYKPIQLLEALKLEAEDAEAEIAETKPKRITRAPR